MEYATTLHADGLETSTLTLRFRVQARHFKQGALKLKCTAAISAVYMMSNEAQLTIYNELDNQRQSDPQVQVTSGATMAIIGPAVLIVSLALMLSAIKH